MCAVQFQGFYVFHAVRCQVSCPQMQTWVGPRSCTRPPGSFTRLAVSRRRHGERRAMKASARIRATHHDAQLDLPLPAWRRNQSGRQRDLYLGEW